MKMIRCLAALSVAMLVSTGCAAKRSRATAAPAEEHAPEMDAPMTPGDAHHPSVPQSEKPRYSK